MKSSIYLLNWTVPLQETLPEYPEDISEQHLQPDASEALGLLAERDQLYVVAGSPELNEAILHQTFDHLSIARYIQGYFCAANVQLQKGTPAFLLRTLMLLNATPGRVTVVGEDYQQDILPALLLGLKAVWLNASKASCPNAKVRKIAHLVELAQTQAQEAVAQ